MPDSLRKRTIRGVWWSAADSFLGQGVTFIVGLVLARLLSPSEYGLIGICLIFTTILNGIVDSGFSRALIRKKTITNDDYNTMFFTNMIISIILYALLFFSSPLISYFFIRPELTPLIRTMGGVLIMNAMSITQITILTKALDFKTKTKASLISAAASGIIGITMALEGYGVWALVAQQLSKQIVYSICLWSFNKWIPSISFNFESFSYMWGFGWKLMVSGLLDNIWQQLNQVIVGKYYSPATLGQYTRANEYSSIFSSNIATIVQRVSYPVLAEIQDDKVRMVSAYRRVIKTTMLITCVCMITLGAISEPLIYCLIGPKWHEAAIYLPLICISMSLYPLHSINLNMLQIQGRSDLFLYLEIIKKIYGILPIFIGLYSIYWMLIGVIFSNIISFFLNSYYTGRFLGYTSWDQVKDVVPDYIIALIIALSVYFLKFLPISYWLILPLQIVIAFLVGITICEMFRLSEYLDLKSLIGHKTK